MKAYRCETDEGDSGVVNAMTPIEAAELFYDAEEFWSLRDDPIRIHVGLTGCDHVMQFDVRTSITAEVVM